MIFPVLQEINKSSQPRKKTTTYPYNFLGSSFGSKHAEDSCSAANVQHHFILKEMLVVEHGIAVGQGANLIFQHLLQWQKKGPIIPEGLGSCDKIYTLMIQIWRNFAFKILPHGCQSGRMSRSSSPLMSYLQLQAWLSSPPEKPQQKKHTVTTWNSFAPVQHTFRLYKS